MSSTSRRVAFLFPGQGSQYAGMGRDLHDRLAPCRRVFEEADDTLAFSLSELCFEGDDKSLALTENTQPAILTVSIACLRAIEERGLRPEFVAGHSLGEYTALVAAGALSFPDALRLVRARGRYMQDAVPVGTGAMAAILGLDVVAIEEVCREAARGEVVVAANYNSPDQTVIAGHADAVRRAVALAEARGAKRAVMLPVSAPFHSPLMEPARERLAIDLEKTAFADPVVAVVGNVDASFVTRGALARTGLVRQVTSPVRFTETITALVAAGVSHVVEVGPGRVLLGLVRRIDRTVVGLNVEDGASLAKAAETLGAAG